MWHCMCVWIGSCITSKNEKKKNVVQIGYQKFTTIYLSLMKYTSIYMYCWKGLKCCKKAPIKNELQYVLHLHNMIRPSSPLNRVCLNFTSWNVVTQTRQATQKECTANGNQFEVQYHWIIDATREKRENRERKKKKQKFGAKIENKIKTTH